MRNIEKVTGVKSSHWGLVAGFLLGAACFVHLVGQANADSATPVEAFKAYHHAIVRAHRLSDLDPFLPKRYLENRGRILNVVAKSGVERGEIERAMLDTMQSQIGKLDVIVVNDAKPGRGTSAEGKPEAYVDMDGVNRETRQAEHLTAIMELEDGHWKYAGNLQGMTQVPAAPPASGSKRLVLPSTSSKSNEPR